MVFDYFYLFGNDFVFGMKIKMRVPWKYVEIGFEIVFCSVFRVVDLCKEKYKLSLDMFLKTCVNKSFSLEKEKGNEKTIFNGFSFL